MPLRAPQRAPQEAAKGPPKGPLGVFCPYVSQHCLLVCLGAPSKAPMEAPTVSWGLLEGPMAGASMRALRGPRGGPNHGGL